MIGPHGCHPVLLSASTAFYPEPMEQVAVALQKEAISRRGQTEDFDLFGRSAFNRYYYTVFLIARALMLEFNPNWNATHSSVPGMLRGSVKDEIAKFRTSANRRRNQEQSRMANEAIAAIDALATLMEDANRLRVAADYNPNIKVVDQGGDRFTLVNTNITDAHQWPARTKTHVQIIRRTLRLARGGI